MPMPRPLPPSESATGRRHDAYRRSSKSLPPLILRGAMPVPSRHDKADLEPRHTKVLGQPPDGMHAVAAGVAGFFHRVEFERRHKRLAAADLRQKINLVGDDVHLGFV